MALQWNEGAVCRQSEGERCVVCKGFSSGRLGKKFLHQVFKKIGHWINKWHNKVSGFSSPWTRQKHQIIEKHTHMLTHLMGKKQAKTQRNYAFIQIGNWLLMQSTPIKCLHTCILWFAKRIYMLGLQSMYTCTLMYHNCLSKSGTFRSLIINNELTRPENEHVDNGLYNI